MYIKCIVEVELLYNFSLFVISSLFLSYLRTLHPEDQEDLENGEENKKMDLWDYVLQHTDHGARVYEPSIESCTTYS